MSSNLAFMFVLPNNLHLCANFQLSISISSIKKISESQKFTEIGAVLKYLLYCYIYYFLFLVLPYYFIRNALRNEDIAFKNEYIIVLFFKFRKKT